MSSVPRERSEHSKHHTTTDPTYTITEDYFQQYGSTMVPRYLQLGNQTVDLNKLFKVPQSESSNVPEEQGSFRRVSIGAREEPSAEKNLSIKSEPAHNIVNNKHSNVQMPWLRPRTQHEHDRRHGPHFEDIETIDNSTITVQAGHTAHLDCRVSFLRDKTVNLV